MEKRLVLLAGVTFLIALLLMSYASALTGRLGNSRMVLYTEPGETVRRNLFIENVNDETITIELIASGDLVESLDIEEPTFSLAPGESKQVFFEITPEELGTTETKINVAFSPLDGGAGVGLSATIIVVAGEERADEPEEDVSAHEQPGFTFSPGSNSQNTGSDSPESPMTFLIVSSAILVIVFIALLIFATKQRTKKGSGRLRG